MTFDASRSTNVLVVIVPAFIASLKVAVTVVAVDTPVAPLAGDVAVTVGAAVSAVVKDQTLFATSAFPATSLTPLAPLTTVAVYVTFCASGAVGVRVATNVVAL